MAESTDTVERLNVALAGRYAIERRLARGGMATVYLAQDLKHRRSVAVKVFGAEVASALGPERFLREIEVVARLNHPHILPLHDSGRTDEFLFYVMPYVQGESLRQLLQKKRVLAVDEVTRLAADIASALDHAHAHGVLHLDIKPENVLLHEGEAMVVDFGIARPAGAAVGDAITRTAVIVGTPAYMSPEQAMGRTDLDVRSDVYSLACLVYELLTGAPPFGTQSPVAALRKRVAEAAPGVREFRREVPVHVEQAVGKALAIEPAARFGSATGFAEALTTPGAFRPEVCCVAVLPFRNLSPNPENEYFADGITEDVIAQLSKVPALKVISPASVMKFKAREQSLQEIAAQLDASTIIDGSVRRAGERVRIVAQMIDARTERQLWTETYDRELTDIFAIQQDVALHIAGALDAEMTADDRSRIGRPPTADVDAYQLYLQGRHCFVRFTAEGLRKGIEFFERAIARDPRYALAHAGVAMAYLTLGETGAMKPVDAYRRARSAVATSLSFDAGLADAHAVLGMLKVLCDFDWASAEESFRRAIELGPSSADAHDFYARMCGALERYDEAVVLGKRAQELDPLAHRSDFATTLLRAGRYREALDRAQVAVEFDPHYDRAHATLGWALLKNGMIDEGLSALERATTLSPGNMGWLAQLGEAYGMFGRRTDALRIVEKLTDAARSGYVSPYHWAYVYTGLDELDTAMDWLERAYDEQAGSVYGIKGSFLFTPLRTHPRFVALLRKMHLA